LGLKPTFDPGQPSLEIVSDIYCSSANHRGIANPRLPQYDSEVEHQDKRAISGAIHSRETA
jgi:hypothetical protein